MCTGLRFNDSKGNLYFGRNLDVESSYGEKVLITPKNYKIPYKFLNDVNTSKAIIGMGIIVDNYPMYFDCCNEKGLCIAGLNFPGYAYFTEKPLKEKINLAPYEFVLWIMEQFNTVKEVKNKLDSVNLVNMPFNSQLPVAPLHWIISDDKESIVVEQTKENGLVYYENKVGVLTNNPDYLWHLTNLNNYVALSPDASSNKNWNSQIIKPLGVGTGSLGLPGDSIPASRFIKAAYLNAYYPILDGEQENVAKFFNILKSVAMIKGSVLNSNGKDEYTVYTSCYSTLTKTYYYNRYDNFNIKSVKLMEKYINAQEIIVC